MLYRVAGGNAIYAARALQKVADVVKSWPAKIQSSKDVANVKGVGKSSKSLVGTPCWQTSWQLQLCSVCMPVKAACSRCALRCAAAASLLAVLTG